MSNSKSHCCPSTSEHEVQRSNWTRTLGFNTKRTGQMQSWLQSHDHLQRNVLMGRFQVRLPKLPGTFAGSIRPYPLPLLLSSITGLLFWYSIGYTIAREMRTSCCIHFSFCGDWWHCDLKRVKKPVFLWHKDNVCKRQSLQLKTKWHQFATTLIHSASHSGFVFSKRQGINV